MLIGSKKTPLFAFLASSIKFTSGEITPAAASPLSSGCFASGIPQGRHLQMPGRSWRAGQPSGDGKPVGPDVPP